MRGQYQLPELIRALRAPCYFEESLNRRKQ